MQPEELKSYELIEKREIKDLNSVSYLMRHKKTGAKVALLSNDDENKVFYIGFRTPPKDSTGVAHILEHSVLCGSKNFPVKDPFVELCKGSLNTFLNAMTFPDKTLYPVASCNEKDFENLMHVYLDAVFYPNIYNNPSIFRQEGWHYEIDEATGELKINGVVYSEMKGIYSSPDDVLERQVMNSLYPDNTYSIESGGDPKDIPSLSYEEFLAFHGKYYHPSNSYIYLYGNADMAKELDFIDKEYLSSYDAIEVDSEITKQTPFDKTKEFQFALPINEEEEENDNTYLTLNFSVGDSLDRELYVAFQILDYALCSVPGAPLKQALVDAQVGKDVYSLYENGILQPYFSVVAKDTQVEKKEDFLKITYEVLNKLVKEGLDKKALLAGIQYFEFKYREADFGRYPKGLMYGMKMLDSWLYDENKPFIHIEANHTYETLRQKVKTGYYEELIKKYLLDNKHCSVVVLKPEKGLLEKQEQEVKKMLAEKKATFTKDDFAQIEETNKLLRAYQDKEDTLEDLQKLPMLKLEDLKKEAEPFVIEERKINDTKFLYHNIFTNGIGYIRLIFNADQIPEEYLPYLGLLKGMFGLVNTSEHSYADLNNEINLVTGGVNVVTNNYENINVLGEYHLSLEVKAKVFYDNIEKAFALLEEMMFKSDFSDTKRLLDIIAESKSRMQGQMITKGHVVASSRAMSYCSASAAVDELMGGLPFYRLITDTLEHFDEEKDKIIKIMQELCIMLFRKENMMVDFIGEEKAVASFEEQVQKLSGMLYTKDVKKERFRPVPKKKNEGFMTSGQVQYVCRAGNFRQAGIEYSGALKVLRVIMGYEYLWMNVRVKGGAYGCMSSFGRNGDSYFVSYRDPNLDKTIDIFEKAADAIASFEADERTMTQYIIGTIGEMDTPMNPASKGLRSLVAYMSGLSFDTIQKEREEVLSTTPDKIKELSKHIRAFIDQDYLCVVGNAGMIKNQEKLFMKTENLF